MKYTLKHRLVGAAVLAAVAVLFLPSFFKDKQAHSVNTKSQIPAPPNIVPEEFKAPQPVPNIEPAPAPENMFVPDESSIEQPVVADTSGVASSGVASKTTSSSPAKMSAASAPTTVNNMPLNSQGLPDAWVVQVGSFTTKEAANNCAMSFKLKGKKPMCAPLQMVEVRLAAFTSARNWIRRKHMQSKPKWISALKPARWLNHFSLDA